MPNYIVYDPSSTPIANRVTEYRKSFPKEREAELGPNILQDPNVVGVNLSTAKVLGGEVVELSASEITQVSGAITTGRATLIKAAAKNIFLAPTNSHDQAIKLGFEVVLEMMVSELNLLRAAVTPALAPRTNTQVKNAFKSSYESKIDNL